MFEVKLYRYTKDVTNLKKLCVVSVFSLSSCENKSFCVKRKM